MLKLLLPLSLLLRSWRRAATTTTRQTPRPVQAPTPAHPRIWRRRSRPSCSNRRKCPPDCRREALPTRPMNNWQAPRRRNWPGSNRSDACCPVRSRSCRPRPRARGPGSGRHPEFRRRVRDSHRRRRNLHHEQSGCPHQRLGGTYSDFSDVRWGEIDRPLGDESTGLGLPGSKECIVETPTPGPGAPTPGPVPTCAIAQQVIIDQVVVRAGRTYIYLQATSACPRALSRTSSSVRWNCGGRR